MVSWFQLEVCSEICRKKAHKRRKIWYYFGGLTNKIYDNCLEHKQYIWAQVENVKKAWQALAPVTFSYPRPNIAYISRLKPCILYVSVWWYAYLWWRREYFTCTTFNKTRADERISASEKHVCPETLHKVICSIEYVVQYRLSNYINIHVLIQTKTKKNGHRLKVN